VRFESEAPGHSRKESVVRWFYFRSGTEESEGDLQENYRRATQRRNHALRLRHQRNADRITIESYKDNHFA
jgi:hypothetical protein